MSKTFLLALILLLLLPHIACRQYRSLQTSFLNTNDELESSYRDLIEERNMEYIEQHNRGSSTFKMAPNQFLSLTHEEFKATMGSPLDFSHQPETLPTLSATIPLTTNIIIDWWKAGMVTPAKDQGYYCGCCYAFATASDIESSYLIKYGKLYDLSEQQIVDCSGSFGNSGCLSGFYFYSLKYVMYNPLNLEQDYGYIGSVSTCKAKWQNSVGITSYFGYNGTSCSILENALKTRPVLASVDGLNIYWMFYSSGILSNCGTPNTLNHAVHVVGLYSYANGTSYYVVKNSWSR